MCIHFYVIDSLTMVDKIKRIVSNTYLMLTVSLSNKQRYISIIHDPNFCIVLYIILRIQFFFYLSVKALIKASYLLYFMTNLSE